MRPKQGDFALVQEGRPAGQALVQNATERVQVGPPVQLRALGLFGSNVGERAQKLTGRGQTRERVDLLGQPEIS